VTNETFVVLKDVLRKYKKLFNEFIIFLGKDFLDQLTDTEGKASFVWILGEFGEQVEESPYILEKLIEEEQESNAIYLLTYLVTASTKLFFKRAPEMHPILASLYKHVLTNSNDLDLRQKVTFYYRLLSHDVAIAQQVIA
jgi:AP-4 complex subunit beta-1